MSLRAEIVAALRSTAFTYEAMADALLPLLAREIEREAKVLSPEQLFRAFNDIEDALAWEYMKEHARDEWSDLAPADKEQWTRFAAAIRARREEAGG